MGVWSDPDLCWLTIARIEHAQTIAARFGAPPLSTFAAHSWPLLLVCICTTLVFTITDGTAHSNASWLAASALRFYRTYRLRRTANLIAHYRDLSYTPPGHLG